MYRNKTARQHNFALVPSPEIPRSKFAMRQTRKQAFDASDLIPIMCEEVLPGDVWQHKESTMARFSTPIAPVVDDIDLETFYFFVPNRILWPNWEDLITGADDTLLVPQVIPRDPGVSTAVLPNSVFDHFGILPQSYNDGALGICAFPILAYFTIFNEWFRDQNLQEKWDWDADAWTTEYSDSIHLETTTATVWDQMPLRINKRHDYFTSSLPFAQKGDPVSIGLTGNFPVTTAATDGVTTSTTGIRFRDVTTDAYPTPASLLAIQNANGILATGSATGEAINADALFPSNLEVDVGSATLTTINQIRLAFQTQRLLERDARGGSRYVEQLLAHFGVRAPDFRLQRPEYLGGSKIPVNVNPIAQTAAYDAEPDPSTPSPLGNLGAEMHASGSKRTFTYSATEHGFIIGLATVRATPTYQQGTRRHWRRRTRFDYYFPVFSHLGEQAVATEEIFQPGATGIPAVATWGYQERSAEYRYTPNEITGTLRSTATNPLDWWHYSEEFTGEPALNDEFITDKTKETLARSLAVQPGEQWSAQIILDILHDSNVARLMPAYSVPGMIDHF